MKTVISITTILFSVNLFAQTEDTAFVGKCYFSEDGNLALVSELREISSGSLENCPVFGLYSLGKTLHYWDCEDDCVKLIAFAGDSLYFVKDYTTAIDSAFSARDLFKTYHLTDTATNVKDSLKIEVSETFIKEVSFDNCDSNCYASKSKVFDYYILFKYGSAIIFRDSLFALYTEQRHLTEGLNETYRRYVYDDNNVLMGTNGYGTRLYCNQQRTLFFIRAVYYIESLYGCDCEDEVAQIDPLTLKETIVRVHGRNSQWEEKGLRVLVKRPNH
jgi:hypothetical protein